METLEVQKGFGAEVRRRRLELGFSQEELAERAELHRTYVSDVEAGKRNPSLASIQRLAKALDTSLGDVFSALERIDIGGGDEPEGAAASGKVLFVEDDPRDIDLTLAAFNRAKLTNPIQVVRDGAEALDFLLRRGAYSNRAVSDLPQVILLDLQLPKVHGLEVLRRIKADDQTRGIPVVVLTMSKKDDHIQEAMRLGAQSYIVKPVDFQNFSQITSELRFRWALLDPDGH